jgi:hypothetical protein
LLGKIRHAWTRTPPLLELQPGRSLF